MTSSSNHRIGIAPTDDFESALNTLVLKWFANGAAVEGRWEVTSPSSFVPTFRVTIEHVDSAELPQDDPTFLDE